MNKVICDVCGTSYPETAQCCPICGSVSGEGLRVMEIDDDDQAPRVYDKGGHFSKANVRKRNKAAGVSRREAPPEPPEKDGDSNKGLVIAVVALLLAIIAVIIFIIVHYTQPRNKDKNETKGTEGSSQVAVIPCTGLTVDTSLVELNEAGQTQKLTVTAEPASTTDTVIFVSSDPSIARVADDGTVEALAPGQVVITVSCGQFQAKCRVVCSFEGAGSDTTIPEITDPGEATVPSDAMDPSETTPAQTDPPVDNTFKLNKSDVTLFSAGEKWLSYTGPISLAQIQWSSDDESIARVENGTVIAVGPGTTKIHGEYNGVKSTCIIRCKWSEETEPGTGTTTPTSPSEPSETPGSEETYKISHEDVTIKIGETFKLTLKNSKGEEVSVSWFSQNTSICIVNGNVVEGRAVGTTYVKCVFEGQEYACIVRVKSA